METKNSDWLNGAKNVGKKSSKQFYYLLGILASVALIAGGIYLFTNSTDSGETPPSLDFLGEQGFIGTGSYIQFEDSDITDSASKTFANSVLPGVQILYSQNEIDLKTIIESIKPDKSLKIMFAYFNDESRKFDVYPKGPYGNTNLIESDKLAQYKVPANRGFFLIANKEFKVSSNIKPYTAAPLSSTMELANVKALMNSYPSLGKVKNKDGDLVNDSVWRLMIGSPEQMVTACGNRTVKVFNSVEASSNGVNFDTFGDSTRNGYAVWVLFKGDSGSCVSIDLGEGDDVGDDYGDDYVGDDDDSSTGGVSQGEVLDISEEIQQANDLYTLTLDYSKKAEGYAKEAAEIYIEAVKLVPNSSAFLDVSKYGKADLIGANLPSNYATIEAPKTTIEKINEGVALPNDRILNGDLILEKTFDGSIINSSKFFELFIGHEDALLNQLKTFRDKIVSEKDNAIKETGTANKYLLLTKNSVSYEEAVLNLSKVDLAYNGAYGNSVNAEQYLVLMRNKFKQLKTVLASKTLANTDEETPSVSGGIYSDDKYKILSNDIDASWYNFTKCMANKRDYSACKEELATGLGDSLAYKDKTEQLLNVCYIMNPDNSIDTYECVDSFLQLYVEDFLGAKDVITSSISGGDTRFLLLKNDTNYSVLNCGDIYKNKIVDKQFFCDGTNWSSCNEKVEFSSNFNSSFTLNPKNLEVKVSGIPIDFNVNQNLNVTLSSGKISINPFNYFKKTNTDSVIFLFNKPSATQNITYSNPSLEIPSNFFTSNTCSTWKQTDNFSIQLNRFTIPQSNIEGDVSNNDENTECTVENANETKDDKICRQDFSFFIQGSKDYSNFSMNWTPVNMNFQPDLKVYSTKIDETIMLDGQNSLFYCGEGFEGLVSPYGNLACGFDGNDYKIFRRGLHSVSNFTYQKDIASYGLIDFKDEYEIANICQSGIKCDDSLKNKFITCSNGNLGELVKIDDVYLTCIQDSKHYYWDYIKKTDISLDNTIKKGYFLNYKMLELYTAGKHVYEAWSHQDDNVIKNKISYVCSEDNLGEQIRVGSEEYVDDPTSNENVNAKVGVSISDILICNKDISDNYIWSKASFKTVNYSTGPKTTGNAQISSNQQYAFPNTTFADDWKEHMQIKTYDRSANYYWHECNQEMAKSNTILPYAHNSFSFQTILCEFINNSYKWIIK